MSAASPNKVPSKDVLNLSVKKNTEHTKRLDQDDLPNVQSLFNLLSKVKLADKTRLKKRLLGLKKISSNDKKTKSQKQIPKPKRCQFPLFHFSLSTFHSSLFTFHFPLPTSHFSLLLLTFHFSLFTFHFPLFTFIANFSLLTFHFPLFALHFAFSTF